eukprot:951826-Lingulodinium_polyedra.AAC.1
MEGNTPASPSWRNAMASSRVFLQLALASLAKAWAPVLVPLGSWGLPAPPELLAAPQRQLEPQSRKKRKPCPQPS